MPIYETKRIITFTEEEKKLINKVIELVESIDADFCDNARCGNCPFNSLCRYDNNADKIERRMNAMFEN